MNEDGFAEIGVKYQTLQEFQEKMYAVADKALELAENRNAKTAPVFGGYHA